MTIVAADALDVAALLSRLSELGPPSEMRSQSPKLAADVLDFDRVLLSSIRASVLVADALHVASDDQPRDLLSELRAHPVALGYPLTEGEIMRRRRAQVVHASDGQAVAKYAFADVIGWTSYVAAPIILDGRPSGFFHADRHSGGAEVTEADATRLASFAACFAVVYERAVLRHRLRVQREEMGQVAGWAAARTSELGDRSVTLAEDGDRDDEAKAVRSSGVGDSALRDLLTPRELDVLQLMVRGETNAAIAGQLVVSQGTVKFHVKNILRKLHAANRAEATSRYLRLTLNHGSQV
jgi:DNA-binding CsgD family transcriptional regulator